MSVLDKTYTPLRADFEDLLTEHFSACRLSAEQSKLLETVFFAGATSAYGILVRTPNMQGTLFEELSDYSDQLERVKV